MKYLLRVLAPFAQNSVLWWGLLLVCNLQPFPIIFVFGMAICLASLLLEHVLFLIDQPLSPRQMRAILLGKDHG